MKRIFKISCVLMIFSMLIFNSVAPVKAASYSKFTVEIGANYIGRDNKVSIPVNIYSLPYSGLSAFSFVIEFDSALSLNEVKVGDIIPNSSDFSYSIKDNKIIFLYSDRTGGDKPIKNEGNLCYLNFKINTTKNLYSIKRIVSDKEIFCDNWLDKIQPDFKEGSLIFKDSLYNTYGDKTWKITFNDEIDYFNLNNNSLEVKDINGQVVNCRFNITSNERTLEVLPPTQGYKINSSYTLTIKNNFVSKKGKKLSKERKIDFYVENYR
ncbi:cohesin domain-containing protein [Desnuesiella massiliensis]|uniref:cohesin domain-containing protein n=1 Tax=Desnuesiella massiliensis TaxID=1650662 RepID=UPI0006E45296|nr:cohesin domain-containing protein [Desnuesiella massiliensis]